jgi:hypothetical protein
MAIQIESIHIISVRAKKPIPKVPTPITTVPRQGAQLNVVRGDFPHQAQVAPGYALRVGEWTKHLVPEVSGIHGP